MNAEKFCEACSAPYDWTGLVIGDQNFCCAECASGKPCGCPAHDHGIPVPHAGDPELVGLRPEDLEPAEPPRGRSS